MRVLKFRKVCPRRTSLSDLFEECIRSILIQHFRCPHDCNKILRIAQVDDIVRPARFHPYALDMVTGYFILLDLIILQIPHLDKTMTLNNDKYLVLAVVPVLALGNAWLRNVDAYLPAVGCPHQLRETAAIIAVHLVVEDRIILLETITLPSSHINQASVIRSTINTEPIPTVIIYSDSATAVRACIIGIIHESFSPLFMFWVFLFSTHCQSPFPLQSDSMSQKESRNHTGSKNVSG